MAEVKIPNFDGVRDRHGLAGQCMEVPLDKILFSDGISPSFYKKLFQ